MNPSSNKHNLFKYKVDRIRKLFKNYFHRVTSSDDLTKYLENSTRMHIWTQCSIKNIKHFQDLLIRFNCRSPIFIVTIQDYSNDQQRMFFAVSIIVFSIVRDMQYLDHHSVVMKVLLGFITGTESRFNHWVKMSP